MNNWYRDNDDENNELGRDTGNEKPDQQRGTAEWQV